jgi:hypothetical protein
VLSLNKDRKLYNKEDLDLDIDSVININKELSVYLFFVLVVLLTVGDKHALIF